MAELVMWTSLFGQVNSCSTPATTNSNGVHLAHSHSPFRFEKLSKVDKFPDEYAQDNDQKDCLVQSVTFHDKVPQLV